MWRCPKCGEQIDEQFDSCWNCLTQRGPADLSVPNHQSDGGAGPDSGSLPARTTTEGTDARGCLTRQEIAELACKVLALWVLATFMYEVYVLFAGIIAVYLAPHAEGLGPGLREMLIPGIIPLGRLLVATALWLMSRRIARWMVGSDPSPVLKVSLHADDLKAIAFAAVGASILVSALRDLSGMIYLSTREHDVLIWQDTRWLAHFWGTILGLVLAIWLVLGSGGIVRLLRGVTRRESEDKAGEEETP
jgi:hypothetical protein